MNAISAHIRPSNTLFYAMIVFFRLLRFLHVQHFSFHISQRSRFLLILIIYYFSALFFAVFGLCVFACLLINSLNFARIFRFELCIQNKNSLNNKQTSIKFQAMANCSVYNVKCLSAVNFQALDKHTHAHMHIETSTRKHAMNLRRARTARQQKQWKLAYEPVLFGLHRNVKQNPHIKRLAAAAAAVSAKFDLFLKMANVCVQYVLHCAWLRSRECLSMQTKRSYFN